MPQILVRYNSVYKNIEGDLYTIGMTCRQLVAEAASTPEIQFTIEDIEWITQAYGPGSSGVPDVAVEIRTIGRPERKIKLNEEQLLRLKKDFLDAGFDQYVPKRSSPLIWMQFIDVDGKHV